MVAYQRPKRRIGVKIVGIIVFLLALTITFADVYGINYYCANPTNGTIDNADLVVKDADFNTSYLRTDIPADSPTCPPPGVPEPATLTLLGLGMGALILTRYKRH